MASALVRPVRFWPVTSSAGRVVPVSVSVAGADGRVIATMDERFAILGRTGAAELTDPARACPRFVDARQGAHLGCRELHLGALVVERPKRAE